MSALGLPSTNASSRGQYLPNQGLFAVPLGVQRLYEFGLYSTVRFAAAVNMNGQQTSRLFTYTQNTVASGFAVQASVSETNQLVASQLPGGESYEVTAVSIEVFGDNNTAVLLGDLRAIMRLGVVFWEFTNTTLCISPIPMIGAGGGIFGFSADAGTPVTVGNNGNGGLWMYQNVVVAIPALQQFAVQCQWGTAGQAAAISLTAATQLRCTLFNQARSAVAVA